jgi:hypothetical protein
MKQVYCANCGMTLTIIRKALPKQGRVIDAVEYHTCLEVPLDLDLGLPEVRAIRQPSKEKFIQNLNQLIPPPKPPVFERHLADHRPSDQVKQSADSTAPINLLSHIREMQNSIPANDPDEEPPNG